MAMLTIKSDFRKTLASLHEIKTRLIPNIPRDMAIKSRGEMVAHELNFGTDSPFGPVVAKIGIDSGNLRRSFGSENPSLAIEQVNEGTWAVSQVFSMAPYAPDVFFYSQQRFGMTPFDSVRRRLHDYLLKGAIEEWNYAWEQITQGKPYTYHPLYGE